MISKIMKKLILKSLEKESGIFNEKNFKLTLSDFISEIVLAIPISSLIFMVLLLSNYFLLDFKSLLMFPVIYCSVVFLLIGLFYKSNKIMLKERKNLIKACEEKDVQYLFDLIVKFKNEDLEYEKSRNLKQELESYILTKEDSEILTSEIKKMISEHHFSELLENEELKSMIKKENGISYKYILKLLGMVEKKKKEIEQDYIVKNISSSFFGVKKYKKTETI